jgi:hypothetical protein
MRNSDRAWLALAGGVATYDLIAADNERLSDAARRYFKSQPVATASIILMTGLHLIGALPHWGDPFALLFATYRRLRLGSDRTKKPPSGTRAATKLVRNLPPPIEVLTQ